jgi:rhodanese-related sulfurtransferase/SAM-dependent methyltransferase
VGAHVERRTVDDLVAEAREAITRLSPREAWEARLAGARLIDIRSEASRTRDGIVPGSFHIPRTVLEWRLDPTSESPNPHFTSLDDPVVVICDHGYSSTLAAFSLTQIGFARVADVEGGFHAWLQEDLPVARAPSPDADALPGSGPADEPDERARWELALHDAPERYGPGESSPARASLPTFVAAGTRELLELGAGQGRDALYFAAAGMHVTAVDFTTAGVEAVRGKAVAAGLGDAVLARRHDVREPLPFADESFDACYSHMLFCMALDEPELLTLAREVHRVLRPSGMCIYTARTTRDPDFGKGKKIGDSMYDLGGFRIHFFDSGLIERLSAGYELRSTEDFDEGSLPRRLVRVTMRKA